MARGAKNANAAIDAYESWNQLQRADSANPHHRGCRIADHAARATSVSRRDDGSLESNCDTLSVDVARHDPADDCAGDVVEKDRQAEYECEQRNAAQPAVREPRWYDFRQIALFELVCENGKSEQDKKQICERHPFARKVNSYLVCLCIDARRAADDSHEGHQNEFRRRPL